MKKRAEKKISSKMVITFALLGKDGKMYEEDNLDKILRSGRLPCSPGDFDGTLHLCYPKQEELVLRDDLHGLIPRACVEAVASCIQEGRATIAMSSYFQEIAITVQNGSVRIADATMPPFEDFRPRIYPKDECFAALLACARRFEKFLSALTKKDPQWIEALERLRKGLSKVEKPA